MRRHLDRSGAARPRHHRGAARLCGTQGSCRYGAGDFPAGLLRAPCGFWARRSVLARSAHRLKLATRYGHLTVYRRSLRLPPGKLTRELYYAFCTFGALRGSRREKLRSKPVWKSTCINHKYAPHSRRSMPCRRRTPNSRPCGASACSGSIRSRSGRGHACGWMFWQRQEAARC